MIWPERAKNGSWFSSRRTRPWPLSAPRAGRACRCGCLPCRAASRPTAIRACACHASTGTGWNSFCAARTWSVVSCPLTPKRGIEEETDGRGSRTGAESILESISDGVFTVDARWRIASFNRAAEKITGIPRWEAIGKTCSDVFRASMCEADCALRHTVKTGKPIINKAAREGLSAPISRPNSPASRQQPFPSQRATQWQRRLAPRRRTPFAPPCNAATAIAWPRPAALAGRRSGFRGSPQPAPQDPGGSRRLGQPSRRGRARGRTRREPRRDTRRPSPLTDRTAPGPPRPGLREGRRISGLPCEARWEEHRQRAPRKVYREAQRHVTENAMKKNCSLTAVVEKEGDGYVSLCPELDVASQGDTVEEATANLKEAVELFLTTRRPPRAGSNLRREPPRSAAPFPRRPLHPLWSRWLGTGGPNGLAHEGVPLRAFRSLLRWMSAQPTSRFHVDTIAQGDCPCKTAGTACQRPLRRRHEAGTRAGAQPLFPRAVRGA